jgi:site-specific DNA recombinase
MAKEIIRVAAYARTSSSQQHTCKTQLALCTKLAEERGWKVTHKLSDDALQGRNPNRPSYQRLLQLAIDGRVNVIIVWKLDRFFRSLKEASTTQELLQELGVNLVSVTEPFDTTTSIGKFVFGFLANVAAFETELIKERALLGYERRVREGKWTGAHVPFGYKRDEPGALEIHEAEAKTVHKIIKEYPKQGGDGATASKLNSLKISCRGKPWTADRIRKILTNPILKGTLTQRGNCAQHNPLAIIGAKKYANLQTARKALHGKGKQAPQTQREESIERIFTSYLHGLDAEA